MKSTASRGFLVGDPQRDGRTERESSWGRPRLLVRDSSSWTDVHGLGKTYVGLTSSPTRFLVAMAGNSVRNTKYKSNAQRDKFKNAKLY